MRRAGQPQPHKRDGTWYLIRRVPKAYAELDKRGLVRISTGIAIADDPRALRAGDVVKQLNIELEAYLRGMRDGQAAEARIRFEAAQQCARALGITYHTNQELAAGELDELVARLRMLLDRGVADSETEVAAIMGGEKSPAVRLSGLFEECKAIESQILVGCSEHQAKKWALPIKRAVKNFTKVVGDKEITALTRDDALDFREWWQRRIVAEDLDIDSANKDIGHLAKMLRAVDLARRMKLDPIFHMLRLRGVVQKQRLAFDVQHVQNTILANGALGKLNDETRCIVYILADTGLRPSEACNLTAATMPQGFARYRDKPLALSAIVNKVMKAKKMLPSDGHSLYSFDTPSRTA